MGTTDRGVIRDRRVESQDVPSPEGTKVGEAEMHLASAHQDNLRSTDQKGNGWFTESRISLFVSLFTLCFSLVSTVVLYLSYAQPGNIEPLEPSGYAIIRGDGSFPSDMLVIPVEWKNTRGRAALIRRPELVLHQLGANGNETGVSYRFTLAGEYPEISYGMFRERYTFENSFVITGNSVPVKNLVFHYERWWDESDSLYSFRFKSGERYRVAIRYRLDDQERIYEHDLFLMPIYGRVDELQGNRSGAYWDFWYMDMGSK